jgi:hypothetical protein
MTRNYSFTAYLYNMVTSKAVVEPGQYRAMMSRCSYECQELLLERVMSKIRGVT